MKGKDSIQSFRPLLKTHFLPRDDSQCDRVRALALVCVLSEIDVATITLCVCVGGGGGGAITICTSVYIFYI